MNIKRDSITIRTNEPIDIIEITDDVDKSVERSRIKDGFAIITTKHTTSALCVNEKCERLQEDMKEFLARIAPPKANYRHNHETVDGRNNAHSHLLSMFLKTTETVQISGGRLQLGTWQSIFFIELDGPRSARTVDIMIIGR